MSDRLREAMAFLEQIRRSTFRSDPEYDEAMRRQSDYLLRVLADEVIALRKKIDEVSRGPRDND